MTGFCLCKTSHFSCLSFCTGGKYLWVLKASPCCSPVHLALDPFETLAPYPTAPSPPPRPDFLTPRHRWLYLPKAPETPGCCLKLQACLKLDSTMMASGTTPQICSIWPTFLCNLNPELTLTKLEFHPQKKNPHSCFLLKIARCGHSFVPVICRM